MAKAKSAKARTWQDSKGVFCLETHTWGNPKDRTSVEPVLRLLERMSRYKVQYIRHSIASKGDFDYCLDQFCGKGFHNYPILNLSFHGQGGEYPAIQLGDKSLIPLDEIEECIDGRCDNRVIYFGSCGVMDTHGKRLKRFVKNTRALAVCGYREEVDWLQSAAFELLVLGHLQKCTFNLKSIVPAFGYLKDTAPGLHRALGFRFVTRDPKTPT